MRILITLFFGIVTLNLNAQSGYINRYWPINSNIGDTILFEIKSIFPIAASNGPACGSFVNSIDSLISNTYQFDLNYYLAPVTFPPNGCLRTDTIRLVTTSSGSFNLKVYWNAQGIGQTGIFNNQRYLVDSISFNVSSATGLSEYENPSINIYPNPSNDLLNLEGLNKTDFETIEIINLQGQLIRQEEVKSSIDVSNLPSGVYFLRLVGDRVYQQKFVKE